MWQGTVGSHLDGVNGSVVGFTWINTPGATPALELEIRDASTGTILNSLPPPSTYGGNFRTLLVPERGAVAYSYNFSWLVNTTEADQVLGYDVVQDLAEGNFGALGHRVIEAPQPFYFRVLHPNGPEPNSNLTASVAASYNHKISPSRLYVRDLDGDAIDEIIRVQWDWDGYSNLLASTQGFGYEVTTYSDGLDILALQPVPVQLTGVVSRKTHGSAGTFDVDLALTGNPGIECRSGGASGNYMLVFTFANPLTSISGASVTSGTGSVSSSAIGSDTHQYLVDLTGVTTPRRSLSI